MENKLIIGTEIDTKSFDKQIEEVEYRLKQIDEELSHRKELKLDSRTIKEYEVEAEKLNNQLTTLYKKQAKVNSQKFTSIKNSLDSVGNSMNKIIKKVTRWGLAVFGIRSAYLFVRQAMSTLSQYDEQLATNVQYIRYLLASVLKPVIEGIIDLVYKLLAYINYIAQAWFGINLFANASTEAFQKQNKAMGSTVKQAKELQKTLAGFDEMNILQENGNVGAGGGGGGVSLPSFPDMGQVEIPEWIKWIAENKDLIFTIAEVIGGLLITIKGAKILAGLKKILPLLAKILPILKPIAAILAIAVLVKYFNEIKEVIDNFINWLDKDFLGALRKLFGPIGDIIYLPFEVAVKTIRTLFENLIGGLRKVVDGVIDLFKGNFVEGIKKIFGGLADILSAPFKAFLTIVSTVINRIIEFFKGMITWLYDNVIKPIGNWFGGLWDGVKEGASGAWNKIIEIFGGLGNWFYQNVITPVGNAFGGLWNSIKNGIIGVWNKMTEIFGGIVTWIYNHTIGPIVNYFKSLAEKLGYFFSWLDRNSSKYSAGGGGGGSYGGGGSGGGTRAKGGIFYPSKLPKLAVGGTINMPGRGVPYNGAYIGERGAEAVVPLTDSQQMALLGEAIGKYITVNANIVNTMNGRVISRELQKVQNDNDFAYNR